MLKQIEGFIIQEIPYKETSKIINVLTKEYGIIGIICKGAKSIKNVNRALTTKYTYGFFNVYFKENKLDLTTVYLKGVYDGKEQATADLTITKEKLAEDTFKENIKLKKELEKLKKMKAQKLNYMQIKLNGKIEDISAMIVGAERYALGRRTYIVQWTCEFIGNNLHLLTEKDKQVMIRDIENPISYGDECDKVCWMQLLEKLRKEKNK